MTLQLLMLAECDGSSMTFFFSCQPLNFVYKAMIHHFRVRKAWLALHDFVTWASGPNNLTYDDDSQVWEAWQALLDFCHLSCLDLRLCTWQWFSPLKLAKYGEPCMTFDTWATLHCAGGDESQFCCAKWLTDRQSPLSFSVPPQWGAVDTEIKSPIWWEHRAEKFSL